MDKIENSKFLNLLFGKFFSNISVYLPLIASFFFLVTLLLICLNAVFWTGGVDDFDIKMYISEHGHWQYLKNSYLHWDGRAVSPLFLFRNILIVNWSAELIAVFTTFVLIAVSFFLQRMVSMILGYRKTDWYVSLNLTFLVTLSLWLIMRPHMARSIYWATGSIYTLFNLSVFAALFYTFKKKRSLPLVYTLIFIASLSGVNVSIGLVAILSTSRFFGVWKQNWREDLILIVVLISGTALCSLAPGNFERAVVSGKLSVNPLIMLNGFYVVLKEYLSMSKWLILSAIITGLYLTSNLKKKYIISSRVVFRWFFIFIIGSLGTILPFILLPGSASKHTSVYFQSFLFVAVLLMMIHVFHSMRIYKYKIIILVCTLSFLLWGTKTAYSQYNLGKGVKIQILKRYEYLESKRGTKELILLDSIKTPIFLFTTTIWDMTADPDYYLNRMYSKYFGIGPVALKSE
jgi:hypothetical protein